MTDLAFSTIAELAPRVRSGALSPVTLTQAMLERIAALDGQLHSYVTVLADQARNQPLDDKAREVLFGSAQYQKR